MSLQDKLPGRRLFYKYSTQPGTTELELSPHDTSSAPLLRCTNPAESVNTSFIRTSSVHHDESIVTASSIALMKSDPTAVFQDEKTLLHLTSPQKPIYSRDDVVIAGTLPGRGELFHLRCSAMLDALAVLIAV